MKSILDQKVFWEIWVYRGVAVVAEKIWADNQQLKSIMVNSVGFGGNAVSVIVERV